VWGNANIGEALSCVVTPYTWSVIGDAYDHVNVLPGYHAAGNIGPVFTPGIEGTGTYLIALILALKGYRTRREARVNVEDKQTFAWMGRHRGALFDRSGWLLPILASPAWWETKPWKRYWWLAPKSIESNFFNRILRPYREFVKQLWKRDGTYVPFEVRATAYQLGQRRGPLRLVSYLGAPILLLVAGGLWFWVETWVRDLVARRGILFPQHVPLVLGLIAGLLVLLVGSWPLLAYGLSWLKFIHRHVHGYVSGGEEPQ